VVKSDRVKRERGSAKEQVRGSGFGRRFSCHIVTVSGTLANVHSFSRIAKLAGQIILIVALSACLPLHAQDKAAEKDWKLNTQHAEDAVKRHQLSEAAKFYAAAVADAEKFSDDDSRLAETLRKSASLSLDLRQYPVAVAAMRKALALDEKKFGTNDLHVAEDCYELGQASMYAQNPDDADDYFLRAGLLVTRKLGQYSSAVGVCLRGRGEAALMDHRLSDAEGHLKAALELVESKRVTTDLQMNRKARIWVQDPDQGLLAPVLVDLGVVYREMKKYSDSEDEFKKCLKLLEAKVGTKSLDLATPLFDYSLTLKEELKYADAETQLRRCLDIMKASKSDHPMVAEAQKLLDQVVALRQKATAAP